MASLQVRDKDYIQSSDLLWIFNVMKGIKGHKLNTLHRSKKIFGVVLQKICFDKFCKIHRKTLALESPF